MSIDKRFVYDSTWHSRKLTADGCCDRHNNPDRTMELSFKMIPQSGKGLSEERSIMRDLMLLEAKGVKDIGMGESVEHFIARHQEDLI